MQLRAEWVPGGTALLLCLTGLVACAQSGSSKNKEEPQSNTERAVPVQVQVKTDKKSYRSEEPIKITMTVKNRQKSAVTLQFSSGQRFDLEIRRGKNKNGEKVWQWAEGRMFTMALGSQTLKPTETMTFTTTYSQEEVTKTTGKAPPPLTAGTYTLFGTLTTMGRTPRPFGTTTFTVK